MSIRRNLGRHMEKFVAPNSEIRAIGDRPLVGLFPKSSMDQLSNGDKGSPKIRTAFTGQLDNMETVRGWFTGFLNYTIPNYDDVVKREAAVLEKYLHGSDAVYVLDFTLLQSSKRK